MKMASITRQSIRETHEVVVEAFQMRYKLLKFNLEVQDNQGIEVKIIHAIMIFHHQKAVRHKMRVMFLMRQKYTAKQQVNIGKIEKLFMIKIHPHFSILWVPIV